MRSRKKDQKNLVKVGIFLAAMTAVMAVMVVSIGKENSIFASKVDIHARLTNVSNLKTGSSVELNGIRVGTVSDIQILSEDEVEITLTLQEDKIKWIKKDSKVSISNAGLVGDKFLEIYNGTKESPTFDPEKDFLYSEGGTDLKKMLVKGESIATVAERILLRIDQILYNLDDGKKLVQTVDSISKTAFNLEQVTKELKEAQMGGMVKNINGTMLKLNNASGSIERVMTRIENGPGTMNSLIYSDSLHEELRALLGGAQRNTVIKYFIRESIKKSEKKRAED
jgi:phospholipid/cholesterol/gamma-HCH transport system substrate-binding protein